MNTQKDSIITAADLFSGGDNPYRRVELDEVIRDGKPVVVYIKPMTASTAMHLAEEAQKSRAQQPDGTTPAIDFEHSNDMVKILATHVVNCDGSPIFRADDLDKIRELPLRVYMRLLKEVNALAGVEIKEEVGKG